MLAVGIILLIACANVAGLMLARAAKRQQEMAVRQALGAGRVRIVRQLLTESVMLAMLGGSLGVVFAYGGAHAIISFFSRNQDRPFGFVANIDWRVLGFTAAISMLCGILFGIAPALRSTYGDVAPALKQGNDNSVAHRYGRKWFSLGNGLVVTQVALAMVLLVGAGLLVRTLQNLRSVDIGFDSHNILIFTINPDLAGYKAYADQSFLPRFARETFRNAGGEIGKLLHGSAPQRLSDGHEFPLAGDAAGSAIRSGRVRGWARFLSNHAYTFRGQAVALHDPRFRSGGCQLCL